VTLRALTVLAGVQVLLVVLTWWPGGGPAEARPLIPLASTEIDAVRVERKGSDDPLVLERSETGWAIPSAGGYPAQESKVDELLAKLLDVRVRTPIATRATSHDALQVGDDEWGRKVTLTSGEGEPESVTVVVGASARSGVHLRLADSDEVYLVTGLSEWGISDRPAGYYEPQYVDLAPEAVVAFSLENEHGAVALTKVDDAWTLADAAEGERVDQSAVEALVRDASRIRISKPVGREIDPAFGLEEGVHVAWSLEADDATVAGGYRVGSEVDNLAYVKRDDSPFVVQTSASTLTPLREATRDGLLED